jgi:hypothetical protein
MKSNCCCSFYVILQKKVVDDVQVEIPSPDAATSEKMEYGVGAWIAPEDPGYSSECEVSSEAFGTYMLAALRLCDADNFVHCVIISGTILIPQSMTTTRHRSASRYSKSWRKEI